MSDDNKNLGLAIGLSLIVLLAWQYFVGVPQADKKRQTAQQAQTSQTQPAPAAPGAAPQGASQGAPQPAAQPGQPPVPAAGVTPPAGATATPAVDRAAALAASPRVAIETGRLRGSVNLRGGRIDDLSLLNYHETVDPKSPNIVLLSPSGAENPYLSPSSAGSARRTARSRCRARRPSGRPPARRPLERRRTPLMLTWDNGKGLVFRRTIAVDDRYMFTVTDQVENTRRRSRSALYPYGLISRHGTPHVVGLLHPARGPDRRDRRRGPAGGHLLQDRRGRAPKTVERRPAAGSASPTSTGRRPSIPDQTEPGARRASRHRPARRAQDLPGRLPVATPITVAAGAHASSQSAGCSPAPRRCSVIDGYEVKSRHQAASTC